MSLQPQEIPPVPEETRRVAQATFPRGNVYMHMREEIESIYEDHLFSHLIPARGQPAEAPWRLALTTVLQFAEGLSDRQAADAVRSRIGWKDPLSLELTDPAFDHTVLNEFRTRLVAALAEQLLLDTLLARVRERGSALIRRPGGPVPPTARAPGPKAPLANSPSGRKPTTRRSRARGNGRRPPRLKPNTHSGPGSRGCTHRAFAVVVRAGLGTSGWPRPICSISLPQSPSMWSGWASGGWARP